LLFSFYLWCRNDDVSVFLYMVDHDGRHAKDTRLELAGCVQSAYSQKST